ncbi:MAG: hypothetical protein R3Y62_00960 [Eubacteriales bacterium]
MNISFNAVGHEFLTFGSGGTATEGYPCVMAGNGTVKDATAGDVFCGITADVRDGAVGVLCKGYQEMGYTGTTVPTVGFVKLVADGDGGVKVDATNGREIWVLKVDSTAKTVGIFL